MVLVRLLILIVSVMNFLYAQGESYYLMGTYAYIELPNKEANLRAYKFLREIEFKISDYIDTSEVSKINSNAGKCFTKVSPLTLDIIKKSIQVSEKTYGVFDITIGSVTINSKRLNKIPQDFAYKLVNYKNIIIKDDSVMLALESMAIDLGGIGKGFAIEETFKRIGVKKGFISIGGDMKIWGHKRTIAIKDPISGGSIAQVINSKDVSISTSGNYIKDHIKTQDEEIVQITVACESATFADAYATALFAMSKEMREKFLKENPDVGVLILYKDGSVFINEGFRIFFEVLILKGGGALFSKTKNGEAR